MTVRNAQRPREENSQMEVFKLLLMSHLKLTWRRKWWFLQCKVSHLLQQTVKDLSVNWEFNWYFCLCQGRRVSSHRRRVSSLLYLQDELIVTLSLFFLHLPLARRSLIRSPRFEDGGGGRSISTPMHMVIVVIDAEQLLEGWCFGKLLLN